MKGDSTYNGINYKKVHSAALDGQVINQQGVPKYFELVTPYRIKIQEVIGLIREDPDARQVYFVPFYRFNDSCTQIGQEFLYFDFGLNKGDTLPYCFRTSFVARDFMPPLLVDSVNYVTDPSEGPLKNIYFSGVIRDDIGLLDFRSSYSEFFGLIPNCYNNYKTVTILLQTFSPKIVTNKLQLCETLTKEADYSKQ